MCVGEGGIIVLNSYKTRSAWQGMSAKAIEFKFMHNLKSSISLKVNLELWVVIA